MQNVGVLMTLLICPLHMTKAVFLSLGFKILYLTKKKGYMCVIHCLKYFQLMCDKSAINDGK